MTGKTACFAALLVAVAGIASAAEDMHSRASKLFKAIPPYSTGKDPDRLNLGKMLFFDPRLSSSYLLSCNTCHNMGLGGVDLQETSIGHGWQKGPRNAPTVFNATFNTAQFWDGRAADLKEQAKGPVQASVEMNNTPEHVVATITSIPGYLPLFRKAFPNDKDPVSFENIAAAIEDFEESLVTPDARFDLYLKGKQETLAKEELQGLELFMKKGCGNCHNGINIGGNGYFPFGVVAKPAAEVLPVSDRGRFTVTRMESDQYVFKAPSLRNVALTPPYFHSGTVWKLTDAVAIMGSAQLGVKLGDPDSKAVAAFLRALTGVQPRVEYPVLPPSSEQTPRPRVK